MKRSSHTSTRTALTTFLGALLTLTLVVPSAYAYSEWGTRHVYQNGKNRGAAFGDYHISVNDNPVVLATYHDQTQDGRAVYAEAQFFHYEWYSSGGAGGFYGWIDKSNKQSRHSGLNAWHTQSVWYNAARGEDLSLYRARTKVCLDIAWAPDDCSNKAGVVFSHWLD